MIESILSRKINKNHGTAEFRSLNLSLDEEVDKVFEKSKRL